MDPNVARARIQLAYPPTFQPGFVGPRFHSAAKKVVIIGYNPGEGRQASSRADDKILSSQLDAFSEGMLSFSDLSRFQAGHLVKWPIYREKGILAEAGDSVLALLPRALRPSVETIALLNLFPFKTVNNKKPFAGLGGRDTSLRAHMWECLVRPTIEALGPAIVIHYPDTDRYVPQLTQLKSAPQLVRVWHPSDCSNERALPTARLASFLVTWAG